MDKLKIINAHIFTPEGKEAVIGDKMNMLREIPNGCIIINNGRIIYVGAVEDAPVSKDTPTYDAKGMAVIPGFVDSHTHMVFGGFRAEEFEWRLKGDSYMSIMQRGGGIQSTVNATHVVSEHDLINKSTWFLNRMIEMGVTTVEIKTGYGLDKETELKMLNVIERLRDDYGSKIGIVPTFMGAHAIPPKFKGRSSEYIDYLIKEMIPLVKDRAAFIDIFTEKNVFEIEDSRKLLTAAKKAGMKLKVHADEIVTLGGAELAAEVGAVSADHLLHVSDRGIQDMASHGVVATLLPLTAFALKEPFAPARKFIDAGAAVALATDLNPGSCFSGSIPLTIALACIYMNMTIAETLTALTINGAAAVGMADQIGTIEKGKRADISILNFESINSLPYYVGMNCVGTVIKDGEIVYRSENLNHI